MQMQMLQLLDGSEDSPHPGRKQANPPATLWISLVLRLPDSSELLRQRSSQ